MTLISRNELAKRWNCHPTTIDVRVRKGQLSRIGGAAMFALADVVRIEKQSPVRPRKRRKKCRRVAQSQAPVGLLQKIKAFFNL